MGSMTKIASAAAVDATGVLALESVTSGASKTGKLIVHTKVVTGDWTVDARIDLGTSNVDIIAIDANITGTGITLGAAQAGYNTFGQAIPKPTSILLTENGAGALTADFYWLSGD